MGIEYNNNFQYHPKENVIMIWQAKAACTNVHHMYFKHEGLLETALKKSSWIHVYRQQYQKEQQKKRIRAIHSPSTKYIQFCVNPFRRAVSSYIHGQRTRYLHSKIKGYSFHQFIQALLDGKIQQNSHHNLQTSHLSKVKHIDYIHMEDLENKLPYLKRKYKLHYTLYQNTNTRPKKDTIQNDSFIGDHKWNKIKHIPSHYKVFYNNEIKKKVLKLYNIDFKTLGYNWQMFDKPNKV